MLGLRHLYDSLVRPHLPLQPSPQASSQSLSLSQSRPQQPIEPSYMPYIRDLPGKPDLIPDAGLRDLLFRPRLGDSVKPLPFDQQTLDMAFTLVPGVISGFDGTRYGLDEISLHDLDAKPEPPAAIVTQEPAPEASLSLANGSATAGQEAPAPATAPAPASASPPLPSSSSSSQPAPQAPQQAPQTQQAAQNRPAIPSSVPVAAAMHVPPGSVLKTNVSAATVVSSKAHAPAASAAATTTAAAGSTAAPMTIKLAPPAAPPSGSAAASATTTPAPAPPGAKLILRLGLRPDSMVSAEMKKKVGDAVERGCL
ncbi:hypothetical protein BC831DRAFT_69424 [Entophlyctis helioformis]|nr:hypothetical protein BC831DRAFT_69424 [Entophlyctis helioformis]